MELLYNLAFALILLGLLFLVKNTGKVMLWGGLGCILLGIAIIFSVANTEITHNLIGIHAVKNTKAEYIVEMRFFKLKSQAIAYYKKEGIAEFSLCYRLSSDTPEFFKMIGGQSSPNKAKRIRFLADKTKQKSGFEVYQDYFLNSNLIPEFTNSPKTDQKTR